MKNLLLITFMTALVSCDKGTEFPDKKRPTEDPFDFPGRVYRHLRTNNEYYDLYVQVGFIDSVNMFIDGHYLYHAYPGDTVTTETRRKYVINETDSTIFAIAQYPDGYDTIAFKYVVDTLRSQNRPDLPPYTRLE